MGHWGQNGVYAVQCTLVRDGRPQRKANTRDGIHSLLEFLERPSGTFPFNLFFINIIENIDSIKNDSGRTATSNCHGQLSDCHPIAFSSHLLLLVMWLRGQVGDRHCRA